MHRITFRLHDYSCPVLFIYCRRAVDILFVYCRRAIDTPVYLLSPRLIDTWSVIYCRRFIDITVYLMSPFDIDIRVPVCFMVHLWFTVCFPVYT